MFENAFVIGHGIGTIASYFAKKRFKIAELDNRIVELSRLCFGYEKNNVVVGDGRSILHTQQQNFYDYIILDAFTGKGTPKHLTSTEFFQLTKDKLTAEGAIILNLIGKGNDDNLVNAIHSTLQKSYTYTKSFSPPIVIASDNHNFIIMASNEPILFQTRHMVGFVEIKLRQGRIIEDG